MNLQHAVSLRRCPPSNTRGILGRRALPARPDQSAGAAFAVGGGDAGLSTADLAGEGVALAALSLMQRFFLRRKLLVYRFFADLNVRVFERTAILSNFVGPIWILPLAILILNPLPCLSEIL